MRTRNIIVLPYDPAWAIAFAELQQLLCTASQDTILRIEHVGSTSVPGLWAKPILDIDIVIDSDTLLPAVIDRLTALGYVYEGDLGITDRHAFRYDVNPIAMEHHLYVCPAHSAELHRHITFRDYLRSNAVARNAYSDVKRQAAQRYPHDIDGYIAYKSAIITQLYQQCGLC